MKILIEIDTDTQRVVPVEPTDEMICAAMDAEDAKPLSDWGKIVPITYKETYAAMLAAAPQPEPVDVEPVAWLSRESESGRICLDVEDSGESGTWSPSFPVYELPPTAEQIANETAEAIAEYCRNQDHYYLATEIENGAWKEFK